MNLKRTMKDLSFNGTTLYSNIRIYGVQKHDVLAALDFQTVVFQTPSALDYINMMHQEPWNLGRHHFSSKEFKNFKMFKYNDKVLAYDDAPASLAYVRQHHVSMMMHQLA